MKKMFYVGTLSAFLLAACGDTTDTESSTKDDATVTEDVAEEEEKVEEQKGTIEDGTYGYHNLQTGEKIDEVGEMLKAKGVSDEAWHSLLDHIDSFNNQNNIKEQLAADWSTHLIGENPYKFNTFFFSTEEEEEYEKSKAHIEKNLNCRKTTFLVMKDMIQANDSIEEFEQPMNEEFAQLMNEEIVQLKEYHELTKKEEKLYNLLFDDKLNTKSLDDILNAWKEQGIVFPENLKLINAWNNNGDQFIHLHSAVGYQDGDEIVVFEKVDPDLPFQISRFQSWTDLEEHWKMGRFAFFSDVQLLANDKKFSEL